jgi:hypothetical protein
LFRMLHCIVGYGRVKLSISDQVMNLASTLFKDFPILILTEKPANLQQFGGVMEHRLLVKYTSRMEAK